MLFLIALASVFLLPMPWPILLFVSALALEVVEFWGWKRFLRRYRIRAGPEAMIGTTGEVVHECDPEGRVRLRGELWRARCTVPVPVGARVRVRALDGLTLEVEPEPEPEESV
jgi:membrane-bound serine protease (ClpP class)